MYCPKAFSEQRPEAIQALIAANPLATIVTQGPDGLTAEHVPLLYVPATGVSAGSDARADASADSSASDTWGELVGHVARANTLWQSSAEERLLVFQGPQGYVSPDWYPTKKTDPRVVPTWNYAVVHVRATMTTFEDGAELLALVRRLSDVHEAGRPRPWSVDDAPADYIDRMCKAIVGIRFQITDVKAKFKMSQNQVLVNQEGVRQGMGRGEVADFMQTWAGT